MASGGSSEGKQLSPIEVCTVCDTGDHAEHYCAECLDYLCTECTKSHRRQRKTKGHKLTGLQYTDSVKATNYNPCPEHEGGAINKFCVSCAKVGCEQCIKQSHNSHNVGVISEYSEAIYNLCLDKTKELQRPFNKLNSAKKDIEQNEQLIADDCDKTKKEIKERKEKIIKIATEKAEKALETIENAKQKMMSTKTKTSEKLDEVLLQCKSIAIPLGLGSDVNAIVKRMFLIESEIIEANSMLASVGQLESKSIVQLGGEDFFNKIEEYTDSYLQIKTGDKVSPCIPKVAPRKTLTTPTTEPQPIKNTKTNNIGVPSQLQLITKAEMRQFYHISKHFEAESFVVQERDSGPVQRMSYVNNIKLEPSCYEPIPLKEFARNILSLTANRHVIITAKSLNLCDNNKVIHSEPIEDDYVPDIIGYAGEHKFVTVHLEKKVIKYHNSNTLKTVSTHTLNMKSGPYLNNIFCTKDGDLIFKSEYSELSRFSSDGVRKSVVPVQEAFFKCHHDSLTMDQNSYIFGVEKHEDKCTIHVFDLQGGHSMVGQFDMKYLWNTGVDSKNRQLFISYSDATGANIIAKYKY